MPSPQQRNHKQSTNRAQTEQIPCNTHAHVYRGKHTACSVPRINTISAILRHPRLSREDLWTLRDLICHVARRSVPPRFELVLTSLNRCSTFSYITIHASYSHELMTLGSTMSHPRCTPASYRSMFEGDTSPFLLPLGVYLQLQDVDMTILTPLSTLLHCRQLSAYEPGHVHSAHFLSGLCLTPASASASP